MNNKGFMMAEVIVVASIVLIVLVSFYATYNKIVAIYVERATYNDVVTLYRLGEIRNRLIDLEANDITTYFTKSLTPSEITNSEVINTNEKAYFIYVNKQKISDITLNTFNGYSINKTYKDYINFLSTSLKPESRYLMILEKCESRDKCNYAYLEVYDEA